MAVNTLIDLRGRSVEIPIAGGRLQGELEIARQGGELVVLTHGGGSSRLSPRNRAIARSIQDEGMGTLLFDLFAESEADLDKKQFDVVLQSDRLLGVLHWLSKNPETRQARLGLFGAGSGAAVSLAVAAQHPAHLGAIVCRGGWIELARTSLPSVTVPTLLIVGGEDHEILEMNRQALELLHCTRELCIVPGASHFFVEPGTLEGDARQTAAWFQRHLRNHETISGPLS